MAIELPPEIAKRGSIKVALVPNYPPMEFRDPATNTLSGFDIDLGEAIGRKLGVKIEWPETSFAEFMPSISTGRVDAILSGFTDYASRHDIASFVDYLRSGPKFFVQQSRAAEFKDMAALCGKKVGASRRTMFPAEIDKWSEKNCGSNPIQFVGTDGSADARTQLRQGRIDAAVQGNETLPYHDGSRARHLCAGRRAHRDAIHRHRAAGQGKGASAGDARGGRCADRRRHLQDPACQVETDTTTD